MASDRMAGARSRANEVLVLNSPARRSALHRLSIQRSCAGALSAIILISNRRSASAITKAAAGAAFTTTPRSASPLTPSSSWSGRRFPPQDLVAAGNAKRLKFPKVTGQEDMPLRPERHIPNSIATLKRRIAAALARALPRCPCCGTRNKLQIIGYTCDAVGLSVRPKTS